MKNRWIASLILTMTIGGILAGCKSEKDKVGGTGEVLTQTLSQQEVQQVMAAGGQQKNEQNVLSFTEVVKGGMTVADEKLFDAAAVQTVDFTTADHMAGGRALPIYCVDTKEKKVGLTLIICQNHV